MQPPHLLNEPLLAEGIRNLSKVCAPSTWSTSILRILFASRPYFFICFMLFLTFLLQLKHPSRTLSSMLKIFLGTQKGPSEWSVKLRKIRLCILVTEGGLLVRVLTSRYAACLARPRIPGPGLGFGLHVESCPFFRPGKFNPIVLAGLLLKYSTPTHHLL